MKKMEQNAKEYKKGFFVPCAVIKIYDIKKTTGTCICRHCEYVWSTIERCKT